MKICKIYEPRQNVETRLYDQISYGRKYYPELRLFLSWVTNPIGIEVEIEGIKKIDKSLYYWKVDEDGSLRDGIELQSKPLISSGIDYAIEELREIIERPEVTVSHRTGVHVHNNVSQLSMEQLNLLISYYILFEDEFFSITDKIRRTNPYCIPVNNVQIFEDGCIQFSKYTALNTKKSINEYNTVEFRHLQTTKDVKKIRVFVQMVTKLHRFISQHDKEYLTDLLNNFETETEYNQLLEQVFGKTTKYLKKEFSPGNLFLARLMRRGCF